MHVNVEALVSILAETARYLVSIPDEPTALDKSYRAGLHERISEALEQSYRVPVLLEESEEPPDLVQEMCKRCTTVLTMTFSRAGRQKTRWTNE